jgi:hypothetical protein
VAVRKDRSNAALPGWFVIEHCDQFLFVFAGYRAQDRA